jgi:putative peptide zinc metalloprotease protein
LAVIPGVPISTYLIIRCSEEFQWSLRSLAGELGYLGHLIFTLFVSNFLRCLIQGVLSAYYRAPAQEFGIRLRFGIIPRFYIERNAVRYLDRSAKLWIYGSSLLLRLFFIVLGTLIWFLFRDSEHRLGAFGVLLSHSGIIGLIIISLPVRNSDGFRWLINYFRLPPDMILTALDVFLRTIRRQPLPASLSPAQVRNYFLYALVILMCWSLFAVKVTLSIAGGLEKTFPDIFGGTTRVILIGVVGALFLRWIAAQYMRSRLAAKANEPLEPMLESEIQEADATIGLVGRHKVLSIAGFLCLALLIPFGYRPGGEIQLLPPVQQQIQAPVSGQIGEVKFERGDGKLIPKGSVVARQK